MTKILWPRTIIPAELYVERKADKQLAQIMSDMGRPGYILVARQMGKTNLLINAKRKYSKGNNVIVYIDLSNRYDTDRLCFRNIIDTILSTNEEKLGHLIDKIHSERETRRIPAYTEHSAELRLILENIAGKLIIILDEIDSLTAADYSDKIFAQIRSVYFERVNFSCLERLTYVLSGVAEPSEIIKDKSISPFNIGQRIVLGDFDYGEFLDFIRKTKIDIPSSTIERIFYWTNGNPRMTWDICSEVEDILADGKTPTSEHVDSIVERTYLTNFDVPPVDHIRSLVESSQELREGIISILYGKGDAISDEVKSKLYLAGILDSKFSEGLIKIKNKVIEKSLDEDWIESITSRESYSQSNADNAFRDSRFKDAIEQYSHLLRSDKLDPIDKQLVIYRLACCYFYVMDYENAYTYFDTLVLDKKNYKAAYIEALYLKGLCQLILDRDVISAIKTLNEVRLETDYTDEYHWLSSINIVSAASQQVSILEGYLSKEDLLEILGRIIENQNLIKSDGIISNAYLFAGDFETDTEKSLDYYLLSVENANGLEKVKPYLHAIAKNKSKEIYENISTLLINNPDSKTLLHENPSKTFNVKTLFEFISYSLDNEHKDTLLSVFDSFIENETLNEESDGVFARIIIGYVISCNNLDNKKGLCEYLLEKGRAYIPPQVTFEAAKILLSLSPDNKDASDIFFTGFQNYVEGRPDYIDILNFQYRIVECINNEEIAKALTYSTQLINNTKNLNEKEHVKLLYIYYLRMIVSNEVEQSKLYDKITFLLSLVDEDDYLKAYYTQELIQKIKVNSTILYRRANPITTIKCAVKFGRNEVVNVIYKNGEIKNGKFKHFQDDILNKRCEIVQ
ncbi:AAA-like domain-containing protein [Aeromonas eucrenophila]|uniref:AAA-like domain-containing protein n=1 Tax=Aeromonas eucrenophila TaxID=649 RepID=A0ABW0YCU1_9GAMM|nr:AAA-like domain-containing protein [Aeromonas eucrenophila]